MKKKLLAILLAATTVLAVTACGEEEDGTFVLSKEKLDDYITLSEDYDEFNVELTTIEVTEDEVNTQINNLILDTCESSEKIQALVNRPVAEGDTVMIDYVGTKDGVAFEGGTSYSSTDLTIGSGAFIPGFEDGLIGTSAGDVVTLDLTFPENYSSEDLAGQAVQFEVTVHYIVPTYADLTDSVVPDLYYDCSSITQLRDWVKGDIYNSYYDYYLEEAVVGMLETKCTYAEELPAYLNEVSYNNIMTNLETYASYYGVDLETYVYMSYYEELETFKEGTARELAEYTTKYLLFCQAFANEKDLNVTEEELNEQMEMYASYYGYDSVEEGFTEEDIDSIKNTMMNLKVLDYIKENANVTFVDPVEAE